MQGPGVQNNWVTLHVMVNGERPSPAVGLVLHERTLGGAALVPGEAEVVAETDVLGPEAAVVADRDVLVSELDCPFVVIDAEFVGATLGVPVNGIVNSPCPDVVIPDTVFEPIVDIVNTKHQ